MIAKVSGECEQSFRRFIEFTLLGIIKIKELHRIDDAWTAKIESQEVVAEQLSRRLASFPLCEVTY